MAEKKNEKSVKEVWESLPEAEKEKISKELEEAASKIEPYSMDDVVNALDKFVDDFSERMDQLCKGFADIFCGEEEEEEKMEHTSKQVINGCNFVKIEQDPVCESTRLTLKNDDDAFEIEINSYEAHEFFRRLIFNDHNCNVVRKKNQEFADEIVVLNKRYARAHEKYVEENQKNKDLADENARLKEENKHLREDIMRAKDELYSIKQEKKASFIKENSVFGMGDADATIVIDHGNILKENTYLRSEVKRLRDKYESDNDPLPTRTDILKMADKCINGRREQDYGTPENNFQLIANIWNAICKTDIFTPELVALCMIGMKSARIVSGGGTGDSWVDICGYAACGGEINARRKQTEKPVSKGK